MTTKKHDDTDLTRRQFTGLTLGAGAGAAALGLPGDARAGEDPFRPSGRAPRQRPNVLFIIADDLGWADLSSFGATDIQTPNIDRLAREGLRFTNAYSGSAVCSPTRFALYTGRYPARLPGGLPEPIGAPGPQIGIPPEHPTLASQLKSVGYETAMVGKWHCGYLPWFSPLKSGWDEFFGNFSGAIVLFSHVGTVGQPDLWEDEVPASEFG
jgi:arylsulfatase A-like enzyme